MEDFSKTITLVIAGGVLLVLSIILILDLSKTYKIIFLIIGVIAPSILFTFLPINYYGKSVAKLNNEKRIILTFLKSKFVKLYTMLTGIVIFLLGLLTLLYPGTLGNIANIAVGVMFLSFFVILMNWYLLFNYIKKNVDKILNQYEPWPIDKPYENISLGSSSTDGNNPYNYNDLKEGFDSYVEKVKKKIKK